MDVEFVKENKTQFLDFFRSRFPAFHLSNVFYPDVRYALKYYLISQKIDLSEAELENVATMLINEMVASGIFKPVSDRAWTLNYPEFRTKAPGKPVFRN
jgi:hypothetical protein